jgi:hypothetical protein
MWGPNYACNMTGIQLVLYELAAAHGTPRAMRHSPVNHTHTLTHTHSHTQTTCIDCDINKQQEQRIAINYAKVCAFVPIRIPYTANMMVYEHVWSALTDIVTSLSITSL